MSTLGSELLISQLRERSEAVAAEVLSRNRAALAQLNAVDRVRAEEVMRGVAARLLAEPESQLKRLGRGDASARRIEALHELFGLE